MDQVGECWFVPGLVEQNRFTLILNEISFEIVVHFLVHIQPTLSNVQQQTHDLIPGSYPYPRSDPRKLSSVMGKLYK